MDRGLYEIWVSDLDKPQMRPLVAPDMDVYNFVWGPRSEMYAYNCQGEAQKEGVYIVEGSADVPARLLIEDTASVRHFPTSFSPDGEVLLINRGTPEGSEIIRTSVREEGEIEPLAIDESNPTWAFFSPDGKYISYISDNTGRWEVYIRPVDEAGRLGASTMISSDGGSRAPWKQTEAGKPLELYFVSEGKLTEATITGHPVPTVSDLRAGMDLIELRNVQVGSLPDGRWVMIQRSSEELQPQQIHVVQGIFEDLKRRVP